MIRNWALTCSLNLWLEIQYVVMKIFIFTFIRGIIIIYCYYKLWGDEVIILWIVCINGFSNFCMTYALLGYRISNWLPKSHEFVSFIHVYILQMMGSIFSFLRSRLHRKLCFNSGIRELGLPTREAFMSLFSSIFPRDWFDFMIFVFVSKFLHSKNTIWSLNII